MIRNTRDSSFYPGSRHAGVRGITKDMLRFIHNVVGLDTFCMWMDTKGASTTAEHFGLTCLRGGKILKHFLMKVLDISGNSKQKKLTNHNLEV